MAEKIVIVADPGIDGAFAVTLALHDPRLEVAGLVATAGNVTSEQATHNIHIIVEQADPPRWPRLGSALAVEYDIDGTQLHGPNGLGGVEFPCSTLHHLHPGDKVLVDAVHQNPHEVTVICLGPLTVLAAALDRDGELPTLVKRLICVGGTINEPGNAGPVSEFHIRCDPQAARQVFRCGANIMLIPLDVLRKVLFSPTDLLNLPAPESNACRFLRQIVPHGIRATSNLYGIEGFHLKDVLGIVAVAVPGALTCKPMMIDVETRGELTRGMTVLDRRPGKRLVPNVNVATQVDEQSVRAYIAEVLRQAG